jgi:predicted flap endonuclease-1-like 5' DNA nuclease
MLVLFSFCDIPWWITWSLPFVLGFSLGWLLWSRYKSKVVELESKINIQNMNISSLEENLIACKKARLEAEGNVIMLKGRLREIEVSNAGTSISVSAKPLFKTAVDDMTIKNDDSISPLDSFEDKLYSIIGNDKLQIIEGIGPKMEEVLKENGINDFNILEEMSKESLKSILSKYGDKYRIIDPNTWPKQAALANERKWNELITFQKSLDTGSSNSTTDGVTDSKLEKWLYKMGVMRRWAQDDLKVVEGIGPKIEQLLHAEGITTWRSLSETSVDRIQEILSTAGPRFALATPATWPKQAGMAADGMWDELKAYQDFLNAGKTKK